MSTPSPAQSMPSGNPNDYYGFYFCTYDYGTFFLSDRTKGGYRHYLHYLEKGTCRIVSNAGTLEVKEGEFFYLPMGLSYESFWSDKKNCKVYSCGFRIFPEARHNTYALQILPQRFIQKFLKIPLQIQPDTIALAKFYSLLAELLPVMQLDNHTAENVLVEKIKIYLWKYPHHNMAQLAQHCNISRASLYTKVKSITGKTPHQIKQEVQVERVKDYLHNTNSPIDLFSEELGFSSPGHLRQVFKAHTGLTPREYRQKNK